MDRSDRSVAHGSKIREEAPRYAKTSAEYAQRRNSSGDSAQRTSYSNDYSGNAGTRQQSVSMPRTTRQTVQDSRLNNLYNGRTEYTSTRNSASPTRQTFDPSRATLRSTLSAMYDVSGNDMQKWQKYFGMFQQETQNSSSPIYSPYLFNKPATNPKYAAQNEAATQKFEAQWADAKAKAAYWAGRTDLNLSDDDIIARVNLDGYSEIKALNKDIAQGKTAYFTRSLGYSPDALYGVIWAARNGGSTGDELVDLMQYARGVGKGYQRNDDIQARLDPVSERYNPYSVGSTADDLTSYFGVAQFDTDWLQKNRYLLNGDDNDVKRYQQVYAAEQTTLQAEAEYAELQNRLQSWFKTDIDDPDTIMEQLFKADDILGTKALDTLGRMDESLRSGKIMTMTRPVEYSYRDIEAQVRQHCEEVKAQKQTAELANEISEATGAGNTDIDANTNINLSRSRNVQNSWNTMQRYGTPGEKLAFATSAPGYEAYQQQVTDAVTTAQMTPEKTYAMLLYDANQYAAKNYLAAREAEDARATALAEYDEEVADMMRQGASKEDIEKWFPKPDKQDERFASIVQSYETAAKLNGGNGADTSLLKVMDYLYDNGKDYVPTQWSATTAFQMLLDSGEYSYEQVAQGARETIEQKQAKIEEINGVLEKAEEAGVAGAGKYVRNLRRQVEACRQDIDDAKYFLIPEEKDFKETVAEYKTQAMEAWKGREWTYNRVLHNSRDGIPFAAYALTNAGEYSEWLNAIDTNYALMTDQEKDTYLYLAATGGNKKAQEYYNYLNEELLPVRESGELQALAQDLASSGVVGATAATALSVALSPAQAAGTVYSVIAKLRGDEINPYHGSFAANMFISSARGTVKNEINDALGEDTGWAKFANIAYDALTSSGDSLLSGAIGSGIAGSLGGIASKIPGGGKVAAYMADKGASVASVLFMGQEAASGAVMDAKMRGATDTQALLMGGITWAAESGTEFLPMEEILDAFKGSSTEAARGLVARVVRSAFEEAPGEMVNELVEGIADDQIMGAMSERNMAVREYMANGMSEEEAERQATKDFVSDILYAGATGAMSGAMSTSTAWLGGKLHRQGTGTEAQNGTDTSIDTTQETAAGTMNAQGTVQQQGAPLTEAQAQRANEILQEKMAKSAQNNETGRLLNLTESNAADAAESRKMQAFEAFYPQLTALSKARLTQNKAGVSSVISGVMQALGLDAETARAAGQTLVERIGGDRAVSAMQRILYSSVEQGIDTGEAAKAIAYNTLSETESGANAVYELSFGSIGSIPAETLNSFISESLTNANAEGSMQQMQKRVTDNAIANMMREVVADGGLEGIRTYEVALRQAEENVRTARENLERVQAERDAAAQNLQDIQAKFAQTPADPQIAGAMQQATRDMEGKAKVVAEYLQSMRKFQTQQQVAETTLSNAQESAMTKVRQEAVQRVMEQRAALEAEARAADEAARQMLAQAQENAAAENAAQESTAESGQGYRRKQFIPYEGAVPQQRENTQRETTVIDDANLAQAQQILSDAQQEAESPSGVRSLVKAAYRALFGDRFNQKQVTVDNVQFDGQPYTVTIFKNLINKVVSDPSLSAEKIAVLGQLEQVVQTADYVQSSGVDRSTQNKSDVTRYDYLASNVNIDGTDYGVNFIVEVYKPANKLKTYLLTDIEMTPTTLLTTGTVPGPQSGTPLSVDSIAQNATSVNPSVSNSTQNYSYGAQEGTQRTQAEANGPVISPIETARQLAGELGIGATLGTRKMDVSKRGQVPKEVLGYYERRARYMAVREGEASNFGVTMHEAGHAIADKTGLTGTQEMIDRLAPEFAKNYSADNLGREAFAEFTRLYMQDSAQAETFAGREFMQQFETALRNAGIDKAVHTARDRIQSYEAATTLERVRASWIDQADTVRKGSLAEREAAFVTEVFDWTRPMEDVDKAVYKQTGEYGNLRTTAKRRNFTDRVVSNLFTNALTDADGRIIGEAFSKAFEGIDAKNADDFISYALMKHALDRDAQGKQVLANDITTQQMQRQIAQMEEASPEYAKALDKFENSWNKFMQAWMVDTGMLSQADFDAMRAMYPHYLPTQRYLGNEAGYRGGRGTFTLRSAKGSDLQVINPLDSIANYVNRIVDTVYKNNAALEWHNAFQATEGLGQYAREITSDMARESVNTQDVQAQVRRILEDAKTDSDVLADVLNAIGTEAVAWRDTGTSKEGNVLAVQLPDGTKAYYQFTQEGKLLYNALTGNGKATSAQVTAALRPLARLTGFMSKMATTYAPTFAASNPIKDIQSSINYGSWATTYVDGMAKWVQAFYEVWKEKGEYRNYLAMGGGGWNAVQTGTRATTDEYRAKLFKDYWKRDAKSRIGHVGEKVMDAITLDRLNEIIENTSRYAEYRFGKHDKSTAEGNMQAFQAAQEVTTDFASGGAGKAVVAARSIIPFLNPNLQGVYRAGRELTGRERGREGARMAKRVFNMAMVSAIAAVLRNAQGDDDDRKRYAMISDEIKTGHIILPNWFNKNSDRRFVRIPISQDPFDQAIHSMVTSAIEQYDGTDDFITELLAAASAIVSNVTLGASELLEDGDVEARLNGIMSGTVFGPIWGLATNQNYYGGQIISDRLDELSKPLQYDDTTPEAFKWLGRVTGASPKALEYLFNQYGGYGGQLLVNTTSNVMTGDFKPLDVAKSLLTSFHKRFTIDSAYTNDISSAYSANRAFLTELKNDVQKTGTDGGLLRGGLTEDERKQAYEAAVQMTSKGGLIYDTNGEISELWKQVTAAKNDPDLTDAERNQKILECRDAIADKQMAVNDAMTDYYNKYVNSPNLFERMIGGIQDVTPYTAFEKLSSTFADDYDRGSDYMVKSQAVWEATGKDSAIPHPKESFSQGGVEYTISEADWPAWEASYRDAYQAYVDANAAKWDQLTEEQKLKVLTNAHKEGHDAAKAWYVKEHEAEMRQSGK